MATPTRLADPFWAEARQYWKNPNGNRPVTRYIVVHHAADDYPPGQALDAIYRYHSQKWPDYHAIAYHEVIQIETDGSLRAYQTNPLQIIGAGVWGMNEQTYHICAATNFGATVPLALWQEAIAQRVAAAAQKWPSAQIVGHREITKPGHETACPGDAWMAWKPALLARVVVLNAPPVHTYRVKRYGTVPRQSRDVGSLPAAYIPPGTTLVIDDVTNGWAHVGAGDPVWGQIGFCPIGDLEA